MIRRATEEDISAVAEIYEEILQEQEQGRTYVGWTRGVYPTRQTALQALERGSLFVCQEEGEIVAAAKIDREQVPAYSQCRWQEEAPENQVMVLHTLVVSPRHPRRGYGRAFVEFYEEYAREQGCLYLRMDTNERNTVARAMYRGMGYREAGIVPCVFNGIPGVNLVCLEKKLRQKNKKTSEI